MLNQDEIDDRDPSHWKLYFIYFNRKDKRVLVPKRIKYLGWTLNFAHPASYLILVLIFGFVFYKIYQA